MTTLYYLVRPGTNVRIVNRDGEPVIVQAEYVAEQRKVYEQLVHAPLKPMTISDYLEAYWKPVLDAKNTACNAVNDANMHGGTQ